MKGNMEVAKAKKSVFFCQNCGHEESKWLGQCPACGEWNSFVEEKIDSGITKGISSGARSVRESVREAKVVPLNSVSADDDARVRTGIRELDRVLGGGIVPVRWCWWAVIRGSGNQRSSSRYAGCSPERKKCCTFPGRSPRRRSSFGQTDGEFSSNLYLLCETNLEIIRGVIEKERPELVVIDSIQTMYSEDVSSAPGSVSQVRESTNVFLQLAKGLCIPVFIVGHVTKEGTVAGPRVLEHMVDTVLYFEGDRHASYRILRAVKNRFGSTNEIGVFEMQQSGLVEVENPSEYMLSGRPEHASGSVVACSIEGTRPILIEIQALVCQSNFGMPRRTAAGTDYNRVNLLMAVLEKRLGMALGNSDAYVNIAGGIRMNEPAIDLGIVMAIVSSFRNRPVDEKTIVFGEVGLSGEVRAVNMPEQRVAEAKKLGFETCILPEVSLKMVKGIKGIKLVGVKNIGDAVREI